MAWHLHDLTLDAGLFNHKRISMNLLRTVHVGIFSAIFLAAQVTMLSARPEQVIPAGDAEMIFLVDLDRPVQLVSAVQGMSAEMIISVSEKCEDPLDAKAALCLRHLRSAVAQSHSLAFYGNGDIGYFALEADFTPAFAAKFKSRSSLRKFGAHSARAASFGELWGEDAGSLKDELIVMSSDGRLIFGDRASASVALRTLASRDCYLPTYGADTGFHYLVTPSAIGLGEYESLGARRFVMDFKAGSSGRDSARFELKCNSAREARLIRPKAIKDYVTFYSPLMLKLFESKEPGLTLADVRKRLTSAMSEQFKQVDNSVILAFKDEEFDMNPQQVRILVEEMIVQSFKAGK
jgi:hypothetical protein